MRGPTLGLFLCILITGCDDREMMKVRKVGDKVLDKVGQLGQEALAKMQRTVAEIPKTPEKWPLLDRVQARLRWDQPLVKAPIHFRMEGDVLVVEGRVASASLKKRALDLIQSTTGVEQVKDRLEVEATDSLSTATDLEP